jgi:hypothetical protein
MQIEITTDSHVDASDEMIAKLEAAVEEGLSRFESRLTRVEVHLGDENAGKWGADDKRCMIEARPTGQQPVAVTHHAATVDEAGRGAVQKLHKMLDSRFGRLHEHKGGESIRHDANG